MIDDILKILSATFLGLTSDLPKREDLVRLINEQESFALLNEENELCGYIQCENNKATTLLRHIVISEKCRGKGLSDFLVRSILDDHVHQDSVLWVKNDNVSAYNLYKKCGYIFDGRVMVNYVC